MILYSPYIQPALGDDMYSIVQTGLPGQLHKYTAYSADVDVADGFTF